MLVIISYLFYLLSKGTRRKTSSFTSETIFPSHCFWLNLLKTPSKKFNNQSKTPLKKFK